MTGAINPRLGGYGFSLPGKSHQSDGAPCQDNHLLAHKNGRWQLLAVADGVGSAPCSGRGSAKALAVLGRHCEPVLERADEAACMEELRAGFCHALEAVERLAKENDRPLRDYDTTLTACLFDGERVCIGHAGDGGVIGMDEAGIYHLLTVAQKGEEWNEVCPLRAKESWVFERAEGPFAALLLLTDGLLDQAAPSLLFGQAEPLYRRFVRLLLPPEAVGAETGEALEKRLRALFAGQALPGLTDDLTAVCAWRLGVGPLRPGQDYWNEPDWEALRRARYEKLYPHLTPGEGKADAAENPKGADTPSE